MSITIWILSCLAVYVLRNDKISEGYRYGTLGVSVFIILGYIVGSALL